MKWIVSSLVRQLMILVLVSPPGVRRRSEPVASLLLAMIRRRAACSTRVNFRHDHDGVSAMECSVRSEADVLTFIRYPRATVTRSPDSRRRFHKIGSSPKLISLAFCK